MTTRRELLHGSALAVVAFGAGCAPGVGIAKGPREPALIGDLQERTFRFFWDTTDPKTGLAHDRWPTQSFSSIAAVGFALTAYPVGVVNGWITRTEARARTLTTLEYFAALPQGPAATGMGGYKGFFYHFLERDTGHRFRDTELSTVDTTLLFGGMLFAQSWFDGDHPDERRIRALADELYGRADWTWIRPRAPLICMGWRPENGFIPSDWDIYNEGLLTYLLALASPTHAVEPETWDAWTSRFEPQWTDKWGGKPYLHYPPLFVHQYSHLWVDFRGIADRYMTAKGIDYFENTRRATYAHKAYAAANPGEFKGYGGDIWGLTACDGPADFRTTIDGKQRQFFSYSARGPGDRDDGTIAPTAAATSIAFAPEIAVPAIEALHRHYGRAIYGKYGFIDSFNPTLTDPKARLDHGKITPGAGWVGPDYLGIDQGPIVLGIENWRTGLIWATMRKNPHIRRGLKLAGFKGGWLG
ncbi:Tat pathway signal protein [Sphingomonas sp. So64.6b]|uniref:glucoamylase family protein n=1 Tax=Sphingomonas sp. So64.6b TaxID=2997354 RepID=UPI0015FF2AB8|nr:glucoamylase family protein [Sphingomonas sp. So64.6b]QNA86571.1 Tat pathway signal protein [Sphingomonas sp. So64.6b]